MKKILSCALLLIFILSFNRSLGVEEAGRESVVKSNSGKDIIITAYLPATPSKEPARKEKTRIRQNYANWISNILAQRRKTERSDGEEWPEMSSRQLRAAYGMYLRFLGNIDVETSGYLAFVPGENARRKIIRRLRNQVLDKIKRLEVAP